MKPMLRPGCNCMFPSSMVGLVEMYRIQVFEESVVGLLADVLLPSSQMIGMSSCPCPRGQMTRPQDRPNAEHGAMNGLGTATARCI